jgi:hypothetical protein
MNCPINSNQPKTQIMFHKICSPQEFVRMTLAIDNKTMDHAINEEVFNKQRQLLPEKMRLQYWQIVYTP